MEKIATDTFDFALIHRGGLTYVDKTALIHPIADGSMGNQFFLACQSERLGVHPRDVPGLRERFHFMPCAVAYGL